MANIRIVLCDNEEAFSVALMNAINRSGQIPGYVMAFTQRQEAEVYLTEHGADLVMIGKGVMNGNWEQYPVPKLWMTEDGRDSGIPDTDICIPRCSPVSDYIQAVHRVLSKGAACICMTGGCRCIAVFAPYGRCGKTMLAQAICREAAEIDAERKRNSVYLGWEEYGEDPTGAGMEELLYSIKLRGENISMRMKSLADMERGYDYLPGAGDYLELRELSREDVNWFLNQIRREGYYDQMTVDIGSGSLSDFEILMEFDAVYLPYMEEDWVRKRLQSFRLCMERQGIWDGLQGICYPISVKGDADEVQWARLEERRLGGELKRLCDMEVV